MLPAHIPDDDSGRLSVLRALLILDIPPKERIGRIVEFAVDEFDVPTSILSLLDEQEQWVKARVGLNLSEASRFAMPCGMLEGQAYGGQIRALYSGAGRQPIDNFPLDEHMRDAEAECAAGMQIAVVVDRGYGELTEALHLRDVSRIIVKPFRARDSLEPVTEFTSLARLSA